MFLDRLFGRRSAPVAAGSSPETFAERNIQFACDLHARLAGERGNLFYSPASISAALAMVYAGARGQTADQMSQVLHFSADQSTLHRAFGELQRRLAAAAQPQVTSIPPHLRRQVSGPTEFRMPSGLEFTLANALWAQSGHPFLADFLQIASHDYQAKLGQADFDSQSAIACREINDWVAEMTHDRIQNILPPGSLDRATRLVLANAIYFKGAWAKSFEESNTSIQPFHLSTFRKTEVRLMQQTITVNYTADQDLQAVELPYLGDQFSMVILLPRRVDGCAKLESRLGPDLLAATLAHMQRQLVEIHLPRFKIESSFDLRDILARMGMPDAFSSAADFSGMDGTRGLFLSNVFHKAWGDINEAGTEAAAATVAIVKALCMEDSPPAQPPIFRADHPFLFFIRDTQSGMILFLGRLEDPSGT